jgi:hypothetical protein
MKTIAKKAITFGLAALMLVSCGKDKNKVDQNAVNSNPFIGVGSSPTESNFINQLMSQYSCSRVNRYLNYSNGTLTNAGANGAQALASYVGVDVNTGDIIVLKDYGNNNFQYAISVCRTGDQFIDNMLISGQPQISATFTGDLNVPNRAQCPTGRVNSGDLFFGYAPNSYPLLMRFQPPQQCM